MRARWMIRVGGALACLALPDVAAFACSCAPLPSTLQQHYDRAAAIAIVKAVGCAEGEPNASGHCESRKWRFEVLEAIKGTPPHDIAGGTTSCDLSARMGEKVLLFMDERGDAASCGGSTRLDDPRLPDVEERVAMLRDFRDGRAPDLAHPWTFRDTGRACQVQHAFSGFAITFNYVYDGPQLVLAPGQRVDQPLLTMSLVHPVYEIDLTSIQIDGAEVSLTRRRSEMSSPMRSERVTLVSDVALGDQAEKLFELMLKPIEVVVSGVLMQSREFRVSTRTTRLRDVSERFDACRKEHPKIHCFNPAADNDIEQPFCVPVPQE